MKLTTRSIVVALSFTSSTFAAPGNSWSTGSAAGHTWPTSSSALKPPFTSSAAGKSSSTSSASVKPSSTSSASPVFQTTCVGNSYIYNEFSGYGFLAGNSSDKFGDTIGGIGSSVAIDRKSWKKSGSTYTGLLYVLPDRGWNTQGTLNYNPRVHKLTIKFTPDTAATVANPSGPNIEFTYLDTILLKAPDGSPTTGLDADAVGGLLFPGFPLLPGATFTGDGFGNDGLGGHYISIDSEGIFLTPDGGFWVSDEYGPMIYQFDATGLMINAISPPDAILPLRNGSVSFNADSPPFYNLNFTTTPGDPTQGRQNNQGFEGLTVNPEGTKLYVLLQSALQQEGGNKKPDRRYTRLLEYDISSSHGSKPSAPIYVAEYVVPLPLFESANKTAVAAQSEMHYISDTQFFILARDSSAGHGQASSLSLYRHVDVFDISNATNVKGPTHDAFNTSIASATGVLNSDIEPAEYCSFLDFNINAQLNRFGVHNGGDQDSTLLNEKWESIALLPAEGEDEYYLLSLSDDDFITQNGFVKNGTIPYKDASGYSLDNQALIFKVTLPKGSKPLVS